MAEKQELNLTDEQLDEIAGGLNKQNIKDAAGKVIKFGKDNVKEILLAAVTCVNIAIGAKMFHELQLSTQATDRATRAINDAAKAVDDSSKIIDSYSKKQS